MEFTNSKKFQEHGRATFKGFFTFAELQYMEVAAPPLQHLLTNNPWRVTVPSPLLVTSEYQNSYYSEQTGILSFNTDKKATLT